MINTASAVVFLLIDGMQNGLSLMMAQRVLGERIRLRLIGFAAFFGGIAAAAAEIAPISRICEMLLWMPIAFAMMRIAAGRRLQPLAGIRRAAVLLACEGFLGGVVLALYGATGSLVCAYLLSAGAAMAVFVSVWRTKAVLTGNGRVHVICRIAGKEAAFDAIVDSGNSLRDYLTRRPVIVAEAALLERFGSVHTRLIFADTAGGRQMMQIVLPQETRLVYGGEEKSVCAALAFCQALAPGTPALLPVALLE